MAAGVFITFVNFMTQFGVFIYFACYGINFHVWMINDVGIYLFVYKNNLLVCISFPDTAVMANLLFWHKKAWSSRIEEGPQGLGVSIPT